MKSLVIAALVATCLTACTSNERSGYVHLPSEGWAYGDTLVFVPQPSDSSLLAHGSLTVAVRHNNGYEYSNLWLEMQYTGADTLHTDTINIILADVYGNWRGTGIGVSYQLSDTVAGDTDIDLSRPVRLRHIMRVDTLGEIEQIGVFFTP